MITVIGAAQIWLMVFPILVAVSISGAGAVYAADQRRGSEQRKSADPAADERRRNIDLAKATMKKYGRFVVVCREPIDAPRDRICLTIGTLSRLAPDYAIKIAEYLEAIGTTIAERASVRLTEAEFWKRLLGNGHFAGCTDQPRARLVLTVRAPSSRRPMLNSPCSGAGGGGNPLAVAMATLESSPIGGYFGAYRSTRKQCHSQPIPVGQQGVMDAGGRDQGIPAPEPKEPSLAGKVWKEIVDALGGGDDGPDTGGSNSADGPRGYCFEDQACAMSCEQAARAKAIANELRTRFQYDGCNAAVTPQPDSARTCYTVLNNPTVTAAQFATIRKEFCEKASGLMQRGSDDPGRCSISTPKHIAATNNICRDPRAMCSEDQVDPAHFPLVPGAGAPGVLPPRPTSRR